MPEDTETLNTDNSTEDQVEEIANRLEQTLKQRSTSDATLANLVADPDIRKILDAKQKGEVVKVTTGEEEEPESISDESTDVDSMTNSELVAFMVKTHGKVTQDVMKEEMKNFKDSISGISDFVTAQQQNAIQDQIQESKRKHPDFDDYGEKMYDIHQKNPGLNIEELYIIAKAQSGALETPGPSAGSERPSQVGTLPVRRTEKRKNAVPTGRRGFRQLLAEATSKLNVGETPA